MQPDRIFSCYRSLQKKQLNLLLSIFEQGVVTTRLLQWLGFWTGGGLNIIKLIGMNSTFAQILGKLKNK